MDFIKISLYIVFFFLAVLGCRMLRAGYERTKARLKKNG